MCVCCSLFLGFHTLFEPLYFQNYCCCAGDKVIWDDWGEQSKAAAAKSILCSGAIKRKHHAIVRIFIEQASIRKVHLIKLCTFKLHNLSHTYSHTHSLTLASASTFTFATIDFEQRQPHPTMNLWNMYKRYWWRAKCTHSTGTPLKIYLNSVEWSSF